MSRVPSPFTFWFCLVLRSVVVLLLATVALACHPTTRPSGDSVEWPRFGPEPTGLELRGHTNVLPDFVGPVDGSAQLTIFTEGNHFPTLLPLVFDQLPRWGDVHCEAQVEPREILVITLPQVMMVEAMTSGSITLGNATLNLQPEHVYPQILIGGEAPLRTLAEAGVAMPSAEVFARHRGLGLLVRRDVAVSIDSLAALAASDESLVLATPREAGARRQYLATLDALLGPDTARRLLSRETQTFPGRLGIQHRDVPYALLHGHAAAGLIFRHLAAYYAERFPDSLRFVPVDAAAPFGEELLVTQTPTAATDPNARCFRRFLLEHAPQTYPAQGFADLRPPELGRRIELLGALDPVARRR